MRCEALWKAAGRFAETTKVGGSVLCSSFSSLLRAVFIKCDRYTDNTSVVGLYREVIVRMGMHVWPNEPHIVDPLKSFFGDCAYFCPMNHFS